MLMSTYQVQRLGGSRCPACLQKQAIAFRSQASLQSCKPQAVSRADRRALTVHAAAAEAEIDTTASPVSDEPVSIDDLKTGVARVYGVRGTPDKTCSFSLPNLAKAVRRGFCIEFRRVIDKIRGRSYADALFNLTKLPYRAVEEITEVLKSAANNAANNQGASKSDLIVSEAFVDGAGHYKRFQARAKGRPGKIQVKKSHLTVKVTEVPQQIRGKLVSEAKKMRRWQ